MSLTKVVNNMINSYFSVFSQRKKAKKMQGKLFEMIAIIQKSAGDHLKICSGRNKKVQRNKFSVVLRQLFRLFFQAFQALFLDILHAFFRRGNK